MFDKISNARGPLFLQKSSLHFTWAFVPNINASLHTSQSQEMCDKCPPILYYNKDDNMPLAVKVQIPPWSWNEVGRDPIPCKIALQSHSNTRCAVC